MAPARLLDAGSSELVLEEVDSPESLAADWTRLAELSRNVFATWEWLSLWWEHYGRTRKLRVVACRSEAGEVVAILPLYMWMDGRFRVARFLGHGPGDELGPVCAPEYRAAAARALRRLAAEWELHLLVADRLPGPTDWSRALGGRLLEREASPLLRFEVSSWDEFLAGRSRNLRQQTGKLRRRLERAHDARFRIAVDPDRLDRDLDHLFDLHEARWGGVHSEFVGVDRPFQRAFAVRAFERGWLRLCFLELDGRPVAAHYVLRFAGSAAVYQSGRDPAFAHLRVGQVLLMWSIQDTLEAGMREFRFLRGANPHKYRLATEDPAVETIAVRGRASGSVALALGLRLRRRPALWQGAVRLRNALSLR